MPTLNQQVRQSVATFNKLFLQKIQKSRGDRFAKYVGDAIDGKLITGVDFEGVGDLVYRLQIEKLGAAAETNEKITALIAQLKSDNEEGLFDYKVFVKDNPELEMVIREVFEETPLLSEVMDQYAKVQDIGRRLKAVIYNQYNQIQYEGKIADDLGYVLSKFDSNGVGHEDVTRLAANVDFTPSLTAHPTNPEDVEYVRKAMVFLDSFLRGEGAAQMDKKLLELIDQPSSSPQKKTQQDEIQEALHYLDSIYDSLDEQHAQLSRKLASSKYPGIKIPDDSNKIRVWVAGDGDGNTNATRESLDDNIAMFKNAIKARYSAGLEGLGLSGQYPVDACENPEQFVEFLEGHHSKDLRRNEMLQSLVRKVKTFGYHYAKIDIRHTAVDLTKIDTLLEELSSREDVETYLRKACPDHAGKTLRQLMVRDIVRGNQIELEGGVYIPEFLLRFNKENLQDNVVVSRLLGRFELAAKNPAVFEKAIVAEFNHPKQITAVMNILKDTGHKVGIPGASLNIVPLAESKANLEKLHTDIETALSDRDYFEHVKQTKRVYFMIARSDTVRRNGVGAQFSQEMAIKNSIRSIVRKLAMDPSISDEQLAEFQVIPYSGGGAALQRGGGKMTEIASVYGRYALQALDSLKKEFKDRPGLASRVSLVNIKEPCLTTQGHQNALLYQGGGHTLASFYSQGLYAKAKAEGIIPDNQRDAESLRDHYFKKASGLLGVAPEEFGAMNHDIAIRKLNHLEPINDELIRKVSAFKTTTNLASANDNLTELCNFPSIDEFLTAISNRAVDVYARDIGSEDSKEPSPVDKLLANGPWLFTKRGNKSSRSSKRGVADATGQVETVEEFLGIVEKDKASALAVLRQRAIGVESLSSHSGTNVVAWLGWREAIEGFAAENPDFDLTEMFHVSKSFRDIVRSADLSIQSCDFDKSWSMLCGAEDIPDQGVLEELHVSYLKKVKTSQGKASISNEEVLGYIQIESQRTEQLFLDIAKRVPSPEAKLENDLNKESAVTGNVLERAVTKLANKNPKIKLTNQLSSLIDGGYVATDTGLCKPAHLMEPQRRRDLEHEFTIPVCDRITRSFDTQMDRLFQVLPKFIPSSSVESVSYEKKGDKASEVRASGGGR